jgi:drug/metabolite transporter (DMT)-like permease
LAVGAWRLCLASFVLAPMGLPRARREGALRGTGEELLVLGSSVALRATLQRGLLRFLTPPWPVRWCLVTTTPIYVALISRFALGERIGARRAAAIGVAMLGSVIIGYGDMRLSGAALVGDAWRC